MKKYHDVVLRLTGKQHRAVHEHLYPGDGCEAVCIVLCGRRAGEERHVLSAHKIEPVPCDLCSERTPAQVIWSTELLPPLLQEAARKNLAVVKIHSHPTGFPRFSESDDASDGEFFPSVYGWVDDDGPHASAVMLPGGRLFGRAFYPDGHVMPLALVAVCGDEIHFWHTAGRSEATVVPAFAQRHAQAFGAGTTALLNRLSIAVIGVSGTGSPVVEMLARLGAGCLVLVDPDVVEEKNLNRILHATIEDARARRPKVEVLARAVRTIGLGTLVEPIQRDLFDAEVVNRVAACDVAFGCMDSVDGRDLLNRLAAYYLLPYFDIGVRLDADGEGGIEQICGTVHYLQPDGSSLFSRGLYTPEQLQAAGLRRTDPQAYAEQLKEKYIVGVEEDRPAVISVNMAYASLAVNELLARLHPYRDDENAGFARYMMSLTQSRFIADPDGEPCPVLAPKAGRGDTRPLLGLPELSEMKDAA